MITYWDDVFDMIEAYDPGDAEPDLLSIEEQMDKYPDEVPD